MSKDESDYNFWVKLLCNTPREKRNRNECFLAIVFAEVLAQNLIVLRRFLNEFFKTEVSNCTSIQVKPNFTNENSIYDILITDNISLYIIIELKIMASVNVNQLQKYLVDLKKNPIETKALCLITRGKQVVVNGSKIPFLSISWADIEVFLRKNLGINSAVDYFINNFLNLANELNLYNRGKLWTCPICGLQTIGYGIYNHQQSHNKLSKDELRYQKELREKQINEFKTKYDLVKDAMEILENKISLMPKIEQKNRSDIYELTDMIGSSLPKEWHLYFIFRIKYHFSTSVFHEYAGVARKRLLREGIKSFETPSGRPLDFNSYVYFGGN